MIARASVKLLFAFTLNRRDSPLMAKVTVNVPAVAFWWLPNAAVLPLNTPPLFVTP